ncbi:DUF6894 family protein [Bradyrhizobium liaoningense]|uniref:DUF6894 family protein n=1 Tax=Bradyrhizobium liaoningense TaxID=43992 RepID=UPI001BAB6D15|nr:hypothetical protein [Bradyrhizobium liaoningense]MBR1170527.1 hypothetical protein [Bradyrhizobium liaoningense]
MQERWRRRRIHNLMPRYFFDYRDDTGLWTDESGEELSNLEAAEKTALVALADAARDMALAGRQGSLSIQVRDGSGILLQGTMMLKTAANHRVVTMEAEQQANSLIRR